MFDVFQKEKKEEKVSEWNNIWIRYGKESSYKGFIKISEQCLFTYKSKSIPHFISIIPLYKINIEVYRIILKKNTIQYIESKEIFDIYNSALYTEDLTLEDVNSEIMVKIFHSYDNFDFYIKFTKELKISLVKSFLQILEHNSYLGKSNSIYINPIKETNMNMYGKLEVDLSSITLKNLIGHFYIKVILTPYHFESKNIITKTNESKEYEINQRYFIPIHNRFGTLKFELIKVYDEGLIVKTSQQNTLFSCSIELPEILNTYFFPSDLIDLRMERLSNNNQNKRNANEEAVLNLGISNHSNILPLILKNRNKKVLEDMELDSDDLCFQSLLKRMKRMILLFKELNHNYKDIFRFKYPIYSSMIMLLTMFILIKTETKFLYAYVILIIILLLFSYSRVYRVYCSSFFNKYIFSYKNKYDLESKFISTKTEVENKEIKKTNYLIEKEESSLLELLSDPIKLFTTYKNAYFSVLFFFTNSVSTCEKIKNLFLWTDPLLSFYFMLLMIGLFLICYRIDIRLMLIFSFGKKFIFGIFYYKMKHINNLEIGKILLEHCLRLQRGEMNNKEYESRNKDFKTVKIFDQKLLKLIKEEFEKHSRVIIKDEFFNSIQSLGDIHNEIGKCKEMLKISKNSNLYYLTVNNSKIYKKTPDPEDIFYYFIQNIKSDFYIMRHSLSKEERDYYSIKKESEDNKYRYVSLSSEDFTKRK